MKRSEFIKIMDKAIEIVKDEHNKGNHGHVCNAIDTASFSSVYSGQIVSTFKSMFEFGQQWGVDYVVENKLPRDTPDEDIRVVRLNMIESYKWSCLNLGIYKEFTL